METPELPLNLTRRERKEAKQRNTRAVKADKAVASAGGENAPPVLQVLRHLCGSRVPFTEGFVAECGAVENRLARQWILKVTKMGWCAECSNRDGAPHKGRGTHFYVGRL
jgi:hypothetical protein